jgi:hypothetical protein
MYYITDTTYPDKDHETGINLAQPMCKVSFWQALVHTCKGLFDDNHVMEKDYSRIEKLTDVYGTRNVDAYKSSEFFFGLNKVVKAWRKHRWTK